MPIGNRGISVRLNARLSEIGLGRDNMLASRAALRRAAPYVITDPDIHRLPLDSFAQPGNATNLGVGTIFQDPGSLRRDAINAFTAIHTDHTEFRPQALDPMQVLIRSAEELASSAQIAWILLSKESTNYAMAGSNHNRAMRSGLETTSSVTQDVKPTSNGRISTVEFESGVEEVEFDWPRSENEQIRLVLKHRGMDGKTFSSNILVAIDGQRYLVKIDALVIGNKRIQPTVHTVHSVGPRKDEHEWGLQISPPFGNNMRIRFEDEALGVNEAFSIRVPFGFSGDIDPTNIYDSIGDASIGVPKGRAELPVYIVRTLEFLRQIVRSKKAFTVYRVKKSGRILFTVADWADREKASPHGLIRRGLHLLKNPAEYDPDKKYYLEPEDVALVTKGYLRPGKDGGFEVYELGGSAIFSGNRLSYEAEKVQQIMRETFSIDVKLVEDEETTGQCPYR